MERERTLLVFDRLFGGKLNGFRPNYLDPTRPSLVVVKTRKMKADWLSMRDTSTFNAYDQYIYYRHYMPFSYPDGSYKNIVWFSNEPDSIKAQEQLFKWMFRGASEKSYLPL